MDRGARWAAVHGVTKSGTRLNDFTFTFHFSALEKEMATHSSVLAWRIPGMAEPGGLPSMGLHRVGHDWSDLAAAAAMDIYTLLYLKWFTKKLLHGILLKVMWQSGWEGCLGENGYMYIYGRVPSLFTWNKPNIANRRYPYTKFKVKTHTHTQTNL